MSYDFLLTIAIIMLFTKVFGLTSERVHMPQVVGALIAGVLVGPSCLGWVGETDFLVKAAEIGVIILMFNAGMDTDLDELKTTGFASFVIALIGVIVPLIGGVACYLAFDNDPTDPMNMLKARFPTPSTPCVIWQSSKLNPLNKSPAKIKSTISSVSWC